MLIEFAAIGVAVVVPEHGTHGPVVGFEAHTASVVVDTRWESPAKAEPWC